MTNPDLTDSEVTDSDVTNSNVTNSDVTNSNVTDSGSNVPQLTDTVQNDSATADAAADPKAPLSPAVRALGFVSLFTDISSEMTYPITPIFLTGVLQQPAWTVGVVEGLAESAASLVKLLSGRLSDRSGRRKPLTIAGYALSSLAKPLVGAAGNWLHVLTARLLDRTGKGLRSAPRDALIAENCSPSQRGRAFGFHRSLDTSGAVLGPLLGWLYLRAHPNALRSLYFLAFIPAAIGVLILVMAVRERPRTAKPPESAEIPPPVTPRRAGRISPAYARYLAVIALFSLGNSSDAFLLLRAQNMGVASEQLLLLYGLFNVVEAALAYQAGRLSDRAGRRPLLLIGYLVFAGVYLGFGLLSSAAAAWGLFVFYGVYYTCTQGVQRALAADLAHPDRRATELGWYHAVVGVLAFPASVIAGRLYSYVSPSAPFLLGAATAALSALLLACFVMPTHRQQTVER